MKESYDQSLRNVEKQTSREEDERRLAAGEIDRDGLRRENGLFFGKQIIVRFDLADSLT